MDIRLRDLLLNTESGSIEEEKQQVDKTWMVKLFLGWRLTLAIRQESFLMYLLWSGAQPLPNFSSDLSLGLC